MEQNETSVEKESLIQSVVMTYLEGIIKSSRDFEEKTGISHAMFGRYKDKKSFMSVDKLEHIFSKFPDLKMIVIQKLISENDEKHTAATNINGAAVKEALETTISILREENMKLLNIVELSMKRGGSNGA